MRIPLSCLLILSLLLAGCAPFQPPAAQAQPISPILGPYSVASNLSADLRGTPDSRPDTWGEAGSTLHTITFFPPPGYQVRILRVYGDFLAWPRQCTPPAGTYAGVLWGLQSTAPEGSVRADYAADNTFLYLQHATNGQVARTEFDHVTRDGGLLQADNKLISKMAVWLNDTKCHIHMEPSWTMVYQFEKLP